MADNPSGRDTQPRKGFYQNSTVMFVPLTNGRTAIVDAADWPRIVAKYGARWYANSNGMGGWYARKAIQLPDGRASMLTLARAITGAQRGVRVETRNGNTLDVRRSNLRIVKPKKARMPRPASNPSPEVRP